MACEDVRMHQTVYGGIAISNHKFKELPDDRIFYERGTAGFVAIIDEDKAKDDRDHFAFVTCKHVTDGVSASTQGTPIYSFNHPLLFSSVSPPQLANEGQRKIIGNVKNTGVMGNLNYEGKQFYIDAASVKIDTNISSCCGINNGIGFEDKIQDLGLRFGDVLTGIHEVTADELITTNTDGSKKMVRYPVYKVGKTTHRSVGHLFSVTNGEDGYRLIFTDDDDMEHIITHLFTNSEGVQAQNIMVIIPESSCPGDNRFSQVGDSGSALVNENNELIGLIFGQSTNEVNIKKVIDGTIIEQHRGFITYACHIKPVIETLKISPILHPELVNPPGDQIAMLNNKPLEKTMQLPIRDESPATNPIRELQDKLSATEQGIFILTVIKKHQFEIGHLINRNRRVMATWHRVQGPAFVVHFLNNAGNSFHKIPESINGITLSMAISKLINTLKVFASPDLLLDINHYEMDILRSIEMADSIESILNRLVNSIKCNAF